MSREKMKINHKIIAMLILGPTLILQILMTNFFPVPRRLLQSFIDILQELHRIDEVYYEVGYVVGLLRIRDPLG